MQRFVSPSSSDGPKRLRTVVSVCVLGPLFLFHALIWYGAVALIGAGLHLYHLPLSPDWKTARAQHRDVTAFLRQ